MIVATVICVNKFLVLAKHCFSIHSNVLKQKKKKIKRFLWGGEGWTLATPLTTSVYSRVQVGIQAKNVRKNSFFLNVITRYHVQST